MICYCPQSSPADCNLCTNSQAKDKTEIEGFGNLETMEVRPHGFGEIKTNQPQAYGLINKPNDSKSISSSNWICAGEIISETEEEAWEKYIEKFKHLCTWLRGYKYWRVEPTISCDSDFENNTKRFRVYSRLISTMEPVKIKEAIFTHNGVTYDWKDYK